MSLRHADARSAQLQAKQAEEAVARAKRREAEEKADLEWIMSDPRGRRWIRRFLDEARIFSPTYTGNSATFYNEGRREFALKYFNSILTHTLPQYQKMLQENNGGSHDG